MVIVHAALYLARSTAYVKFLLFKLRKRNLDTKEDAFIFDFHLPAINFDNIEFFRKNKKLVLNKICIAINSSIMIPHYESIIKNLNPEDFLITFPKLTKKSEYIAIKKFCKGRYNYIPADILLTLPKNFFVFKTLIAHHCGSIYNHKSHSKLGLEKVRVIYGLGKSNWMFNEVNANGFDFHLVYGDYARRKTLKNFHSNEKVFKIGYPRFDKAFMSSPDNIKKELGVNNDDVLIAWLPTHGNDASSIKNFIDLISKVNKSKIFEKKITVIVKTHFLETEQNIDLLKENKIKLIEDPLYNNSLMMKASDFVFCDYGGSMFGAILLQKKLILLNNEDVLSNDKNRALKYYHSQDGEVDSLDIKIRKDVFNIDKNQELDSLLEAMRNEKLWKLQQETLEKYRKDLFEPYPGFAGEVAADCIKGIHLDKVNEINYNIDKIVKKNNTNIK